MGDGRHTLSWLYVKDEDGSGDGEDCAWLDNVVWTADDPLPPLDVVATDNDAKAVIAGLSDVRLAGEIGGTAAYSTFRDWVDGNGLSHALVRDAPNARLSYVLDAPGLMAKASLTSEDVVIESIAPSRRGRSRTSTRRRRSRRVHPTSGCRVPLGASSTRPPCGRAPRS